MKALNKLNKFQGTAILVLALLFNVGCGTVGIVVRGGGGGSSTPPPSYPSYRSLKIPPGHLPPPGSCKIWYPGKPPGHQPPPTSCEAAFRDVVAGAWVLYRDAGNTEILEVKEKQGHGPHVEIIVKHYIID